MPDLLALAPNAFLFPAAVNSLVFVQGSGVLVVDTGLDEQHARKLLRGLEAQRLTPTAILNTHSHADHHGGNAAFLKRFPELPIYAPPFEAAIIANPLLEPFYLYGAHPPQAFQTKFLLAPASPAQAVESGLVTLGGVAAELIEVPGHASRMYAVRVGEVLYAADALFGPEALSKHPLTFCVDSAAMKRSAQSLLNQSSPSPSSPSQSLPSLGGVRLTVPGHGQPTEDLPALVAANLSAFERITRAVHEAVTHACTVDTALTRVCDSLEVGMANPGAVLLNRSVVSAHLAELVELGQVTFKVEGNQLLFAGQL